MKRKVLLLYDGKCNICNSLVQLSVNRTASDVEMTYASLQSAFAKRKLEQYKVDCFTDKKDPDVPTTSVTITNGKAYVKAEAVRQAVKHLVFPYSILAWVMAVVPLFIANFLYERFADVRFTLFGGTQTVQPIPKDKEHLFLDRHEDIHVCPMPKKM